MTKEFYDTLLTNQQNKIEDLEFKLSLIIDGLSNTAKERLDIAVAARRSFIAARAAEQKESMDLAIRVWQNAEAEEKKTIK